MTAADHLNPGQFRMPMDQILRSGSWDAEERGMTTVGELLPHLAPDFEDEDYGPGYAATRKSMEQRGQTQPITTLNGKFDDGHHRISIARDLGWTHMNVQHYVTKTRGGS